MRQDHTAASSRKNAQQHPLKGRHAIVTGASRGVGRGAALGLAEAGATVFITGRNRDDLQETARLVCDAGGHCHPVICDHEDDGSVLNLFNQVQNYLATKAGGAPLDLLVNNAFAGAPYIAQSMDIPVWLKSVVQPDQPDPHAPPGAYWDKVNNVGLRSNYVAAIYALRIMLPQRSGIIINISSLGGVTSLFDAVYCAGKTANDRMVAELALALVEPKDTGVRMFTLYPGIVTTEIIVQVAEQRTREATTAGADPRSPDTASPSSISRYMWNAESPTYVGRVIAAILADKSDTSQKRRNGNIVICAEAGRKYRVRDVDGAERYSMRSLRTIIFSAVPFLRRSVLHRLVPDIYIPWFVVKLTIGNGPSVAR